MTKGDIDCADAQEVLKRYHDAPYGDGGPGTRGGNAQIWDSTEDGWGCASPTYVMSQEEGLSTSCGNEELGASFFIPLYAIGEKDYRD